jgi:hypothetical protein
MSVYILTSDYPETTDTLINKDYTSQFPYKWSNKLINKKPWARITKLFLENTDLLKHHDIPFAISVILKITTKQYEMIP